MNFLNRKSNTIPTWASIFNHKEYRAFIEALDNFFQNSHKLHYSIQDGVLNPEENNLGLSHLGLENLTRFCKQQKVKAYPEIVQAHFNSLIETYNFQDEFENILKDYEKVKRYIAVRLFPKDYLANIGSENFLSKIFAGELLAVIVFDLPHAVVTIKPEQTSTWSKTLDELFEIGLQNVRRNYKTNVEAIKFGPKNEVVYSCESDHFFVPNILFDLKAKDGWIGSGGALVAAPTRNLVLVHPINDLSTIGVINKLFKIVPDIFKSNPGSLTMELYWYTSDQFIMLPYEIDKKEIRFSPPDEFVTLLNSLSATT